MNKQQFLKWLPGASQNLIIQGQMPLVMGILNVTPDSFSDGGRYSNCEDAFRKAMQMISEGANVIDIGGESARPGAQPASTQEEIDRVIPVIERIRQQTDVCISIDTTKAKIMQAAITSGADIINDIQALRGENSLETAATLGVPVVLMHMQGNPRTMQHTPEYKQGVVEALMDFFTQQIARCQQAGIDKQQLILDIGFGFGKSVEHNLNLMHRLKDFTCFELPVLLGVSRKSTLGKVVNEPIDNRLHAGTGLAVYAALQGVNIIRTHDVAPTLQALRMVQAIYE